MYKIKLHSGNRKASLISSFALSQKEYLMIENMTKKERYRYVLDYFRARTPEVTTELEFGSVFQLLVAVILSAQCTDKRVNQITLLCSNAIPTPQAWRRQMPTRFSNI